MNDESLGHAVAMLEGSIEILMRQCEARQKLQGDKFQRMMSAAKKLAEYITKNASKSE